MALPYLSKRSVTDAVDDERHHGPRCSYGASEHQNAYTNRAREKWAREPANAAVRVSARVDGNAFVTRVMMKVESSNARTDRERGRLGDRKRATGHVTDHEHEVAGTNRRGGVQVERLDKDIHDMNSSDGERRYTKTSRDRVRSEAVLTQDVQWNGRQKPAEQGREHARPLCCGVDYDEERQHAYKRLHYRTKEWRHVVVDPDEVQEGQSKERRSGVTQEIVDGRRGERRTKTTTLTGKYLGRKRDPRPFIRTNSDVSSELTELEPCRRPARHGDKGRDFIRTSVQRQGVAGGRKRVSWVDDRRE